ncbi:hypothetical protein GUJ93_ZPchr0008g12827 [Zizania palustris]|uniref:Peptide N-acetyl-beta-D-glucosaminyl asparaginase amidase A N-terminal domain-containing protein n=1 Tax=Zizania palustris TaxID=103762 RepID=A0A8J5V0X7_ZIZPA|nr:hypothetical protein GUJ93_ZPchr0008g12827 [Zizania palustris]
MAMSGVHLLFLVIFIPASVASRRNLRLSPTDVSVPDAAEADTPTTYFEVDRKLRPPVGSSGPCSTLLMSHSFGFTYTKPPVTAAYSPPGCLVAAGGGASAISLAVLEWRATCRGVQFDRIFGVWLAGAELLRSCTAEPRPNGIVWSISKDVTRYASLLAAGNSTLAVYLGNLVNDQYTGVYHANITLHLYLRPTQPRQPAPATAPADMIVPVSRSLPLNDGLWFQIQNAAEVESASITLPPNAYRAVLEIYVSFHGQDEFWYWYTADGKGPFREVTVLVDGVLVGAVWPFPVIFTGGINPLLWSPITGIGSFNLPTYDIELTPFLGKMLDGKAHELGFAVTNAVDVWYVDGNLHLWLVLEPRDTPASSNTRSQLALASRRSHVLTIIGGWSFVFRAVRATIAAAPSPAPPRSQWSTIFSVVAAASPVVVACHGLLPPRRHTSRVISTVFFLAIAAPTCCAVPLDPSTGGTATTASLVSYDAPPLAANTTSQFDGPNRQYYTTASRRISATGWVESSSHGRITTNTTQTLTFENTNALTGNSTAETVNQTTVIYTAVSATDLAVGAVLYSQQAHQNFPLYMDTGEKLQTSHAANLSYAVARGYHETVVAAGEWLSCPYHRSLRNTQSGGVDVETRDGKEVATSWGTRQTYIREATDGCYFRNVTSSGYGILSDESNEVCSSLPATATGASTA